MKRFIHILAVSLVTLMASDVSLSGHSASKTLMFDVFLDGKKIGYHRFEIDVTMLVRTGSAVVSRRSTRAPTRMAGS